MADWRQYVDSFLKFNEREVLQGAGRISHEHMEQVATARYAEFNSKRLEFEAKQADADDIQSLEAIERESKGSKR